jgi:hypothetical protein
MTITGSQESRSGSRWLLCVASLGTEDAASRMRVLRTLESLGAAVIREGAYVIPDTPMHAKALERLCDYIAKGPGRAELFQVTARTSAQQQALRKLFDRSARYEALVKTIESLRIGFGHSDPSAISRVLQKQRRELEAIAALDFFPGAARERAQRSLAAAEEAVSALLFPAGRQPVFGGAEALLGRTWATRKPLWADRLACAWLIRRFVDPEAQLVWMEKGDEPQPGWIGFAFEGAAFANSQTRVTYEEMLAQLELAGSVPLGKIAGIVHYLEVRGTAVPEAAGVQTLLHGAVRRCPGEDDLLREAEKTFDLLYEAYQEPARPQAQAGSG